MADFQKFADFKMVVLFTIHRESDSEPNGLDLKEMLEEDVYEESINHGRVYESLGELVSEGYVEKHPVGQESNRYELTENGEQLCTEYYQWICRKMADDFADRAHWV